MPLPNQDFALQKTRLLLERLLAPWRRRGFSLLQVGLGHGLLPDCFCRAGYEVTALDPSAHQLSEARSRVGPLADFYLGQPDQQPFDDNSFDLVVLNRLGLDQAIRPDSQAILQEALRLAQRGIIILEWNKYSLGVFHNHLARPRVRPARLSALVRELCPDCQSRLFSVLALPPACWPQATESSCRIDASTINLDKQRINGSFLDNLVFSLAIGALMGLRIELEPLSAAMIGTVTEQPRKYSEGQVVSLTQSEESSGSRAFKNGLK